MMTKIHCLPPFSFLIQFSFEWNVPSSNFLRKLIQAEVPMAPRVHRSQRTNFQSEISKAQDDSQPRGDQEGVGPSTPSPKQLFSPLHFPAGLVSQPSVWEKGQQERCPVRPGWKDGQSEQALYSRQGGGCEDPSHGGGKDMPGRSVDISLTLPRREREEAALEQS